MSDDWDVIIITYINTILFLHVHNGFYYSTFDWIRLSDSYLLKRSCTPCCAKSMYSYPTRIGSWHRRAPQIEYHVQRTNVFLISIVYTRKATYQISNHSINWDPIFLWRNFSLSFKAVKIASSTNTKFISECTYNHQQRLPLYTVTNNKF